MCVCVSERVSLREIFVLMGALRVVVFGSVFMYLRACVRLCILCVCARLTVSVNVRVRARTLSQTFLHRSYLFSQSIAYTFTKHLDETNMLGNKVERTLSWIT